ncbi:hypothetical protein BS50DRAFT_272280 [Corynespora cassiicola Philippines]|uniref:Uncharacterized protein n=1 Tax=Corynespora cassiicola Philippines TaxID=1448308 RepID=A0A2T2P125_CORCC|nr:hypothetical protein BS50DRAFT_272280 [Corynespora cassiicola Philippines]
MFAKQISFRLDVGDVRMQETDLVFILAILSFLVHHYPGGGGHSLIFFNCNWLSSEQSTERASGSTQRHQHGTQQSREMIKAERSGTLIPRKGTAKIGTCLRISNWTLSSSSSSFIIGRTLGRLIVIPTWRFGHFLFSFYPPGGPKVCFSCIALLFWIFFCLISLGTERLHLFLGRARKKKRKFPWEDASVVSTVVHGSD